VLQRRNCGAAVRRARVRRGLGGASATAAAGWPAAGPAWLAAAALAGAQTRSGCLGVGFASLSV